MKKLRTVLISTLFVLLLAAILSASSSSGIPADYSGEIKLELELSQNLACQFKTAQTILDTLFESWLEGKKNDDSIEKKMNSLEHLNFVLKEASLKFQGYISISNDLKKEAIQLEEVLNEKDQYNSLDILKCFSAYEEACRRIYQISCQYYKLREDWLGSLDKESLPEGVKKIYQWSIDKNNLDQKVSKVVNYMKLDVLKCLQKKDSSSQFEKHFNILEGDIQAVRDMQARMEENYSEFAALNNEINSNIDKLELCLDAFIDFIELPDKAKFKKYIKLAAAFDASSSIVFDKYYQYFKKILN